MRIKIQALKSNYTRDIPERATATKMLKPFSEYDSLTFRVLGVPFGGHIEGRDTYGEAFYKDTDIVMNIGDSVPITYLHGFGPDDPCDWQNPPVITGRAVYAEVNEQGHWFDAKFDMSEELAMRCLKAEIDNLRASSGAIDHLVRMGDAGLINVWPVGELAIFDTNEWRQPANQLAVVTKGRKSGTKGEVIGEKQRTESDAYKRNLQLKAQAMLSLGEK